MKRIMIICLLLSSFGTLLFSQQTPRESDEAAKLLSGMMEAIIHSLKEHRAFQQYYHAEKGIGSGERNAVSGLAPLGLFLETLGVRLISPRKVRLTGFTPFPWTVTIRYLGMSVLRQKDNTTVTFPDGQTVVVDDPAPQFITLVQEQTDLD